MFLHFSVLFLNFITESQNLIELIIQNTLSKKLIP